MMVMHEWAVACKVCVISKTWHSCNGYLSMVGNLISRRWLAFGIVKALNITQSLNHSSAQTGTLVPWPPLSSDQQANWLVSCIQSMRTHQSISHLL
jgi:hypothetical protein